MKVVIMICVCMTPTFPVYTFDKMLFKLCILPLCLLVFFSEFCPHCCFTLCSAVLPQAAIVYVTAN